MFSKLKTSYNFIQQISLFEMEIIVGEEADMKIAAQREMLHMFFLKGRCHNVWLMRGNHVMGPWLAIGVATLYMYSINTVQQNHNHRIQYHTIPKETHVGHRPLLTKPLLMAATRECSPPGVLPNIFIFLPKHPSCFLFTVHTNLYLAHTSHWQLISWEVLETMKGEEKIHQVNISLYLISWEASLKGLRSLRYFRVLRGLWEILEFWEFWEVRRINVALTMFSLWCRSCCWAFLVGHQLDCSSFVTTPSS